MHFLLLVALSFSSTHAEADTHYESNGRSIEVLEAEEEMEKTFGRLPTC